MKRSAFFMFFYLCFSSSIMLANDFPDLPENPDAQGRGLINTDVAALNAKVSELERRINDMDRDRRFDQDRMRQLDRDVSELKRRF